jgi:outer membrane protein assembly factor BamB
MPGCCNLSRSAGPIALFAIGAVVLAGLFAWKRDNPTSSGSVAVAADASPSANDDWPMFGGTPARNMVNLRDKNVPTQWKVKKGAEKNIKWQATLGTLSYGGPVIAGGKVFVGTNNENPRDPKVEGDKGILMCFNAADGKFLWQAVHDKVGVENNDYSKQGIASAPVVEGNRLYYVSNRCEVVCADTEPAKGTTNVNIIWRLDMMKELKVYPRYLANCSPLIGGDLIFVETSNGVDEHYKIPEPTAPSFVAIDKKTGKVKWQKNYPGPNLMDGAWGSPAYAVVKGKAQVLFPGGDGWLYGLDAATGEIVWKFDCNPKKTVFKPLGRGDKNFMVATPIVYEDRAYIGVGLNPEDGAGPGHFWCIDITKTGDISPVDNNFDPKAAVNKESGLVWHLGEKAKEGADRDYTFGRTISTACAHDGLVYIADLDGFLYCHDAKTGQKYWEHDFKASTWASPYYVDGKIYLGTDDGEIHVFAVGKEKKLLASNGMDKPVKGPIVVAGGVVYVMTDSTLYAISGK